MDWARAIDRNRDDLLHVVARLFVMAGIRTGRSVILLPRALRFRILALLRPAEFAARRIIVMAACKLVVVVVRAARTTTQSQQHDVRPQPGGANALPAFALFDPFKHYGDPWIEDGGDDPAPRDEPEFLPPDELLDARVLARRILALEAALQDIERHAARLARWRARRNALAGSGPGRRRLRPNRWSPIRPGRPPGWRERPKTEIEQILKECHFLGRDAWNTS